MASTQFTCDTSEDLEKQLEQLPNLDAVIILNIKGGRRLSHLPDSLGQLTSLQFLHLSCQQLAALPQSLGQLSHLQTLELSGCQQLVDLPSSLGLLSLLQTLRLSACVQLAALPETLGQLSSLQTLELRGCQQLAALPDSLGQLCGLQTLEFSGCIQLVALPDSLSRLSDLQLLDLSGCLSLTRLDLGASGSLPALRSLDLRGCSSLNSLYLGGADSLPALQSLDLSGCSALTHIHPGDIARLTALETLRLDNCDELMLYPEFAHLQRREQRLRDERVERAKVFKAREAELGKEKEEFILCFTVYLAFLGLVFVGVSMATKLSCRTFFMPIFFSGFATFLAVIVLVPKAHRMGVLWKQYDDAEWQFLVADHNCRVAESNMPPDIARKLNIEFAPGWVQRAMMCLVGQRGRWWAFTTTVLLVVQAVMTMGVLMMLCWVN